MFDSDMANLGVRSNLPALDMHSLSASRTSKSVRLSASASGLGSEVYLDANAWLPAAAEQYNISKDLRDYILAPVVVNISEIPNTNGDEFSKKEWLTFNVNQKRLAFQTFKGAPCHKEHQNKNHRLALGVILDSHLRKLEGFNGDHAKLLLLHAFDRSRDPERARRILSGELNTYSIGVWYSAYTCSVCGQTFTNASRVPCAHTQRNRPVYRRPDGSLVYRHCHNLTGFESSSVEDPAFVCAAGLHEQLIVPGGK
jgi:hypothetical protein